jgi:hypothetical protein
MSIAFPFVYLRNVFCSIALLAPLVFSGCNREPFSYISRPGKVSYEDGSRIPAPELKLTFIPENPPPGPDPNIVAPKGRVKIEGDAGDGMSFESETSRNWGDGLVPGKHKVQVLPVDEKDSVIPGLVPPEYEDPRLTPVEVDTASPELIIKVKKPAAGGK